MAEGVEKGDSWAKYAVLDFLAGVAVLLEIDEAANSACLSFFA